MNELSCVHGSERYGACDDEHTNGNRNAGSDPPGRNEFGKSGKKPHLFSNLVKTAKNPLFLYRCPHHSAMRRTANAVRRSVCAFTEPQKIMRNCENGKCPLRTGVHGRQFQRMAVHDYSRS